ncbi:hypothetical protein Hanom_Chr10g00956511 [Helianthus anomalus]
MNKHKQRSCSFVYVRERSVTCPFVFDSALMFLVFISIYKQTQTQTNTNKFISLTNEHEHKISFDKCS